MALFDRKPLVINDRIIFSPKDLSSGEIFVLVAIKLYRMLMAFGGYGVAAGLIANMLRLTFDFPWSWDVFFMWGIVAGFLSIFPTALEFLTWWWITDEEVQKYKTYYDYMASQKEKFMKDNAIDYHPEPIPPKVGTVVEKEKEKEKAKVIPISSKKKKDDDDEKK